MGQKRPNTSLKAFSSTFGGRPPTNSFRPEKPPVMSSCKWIMLKKCSRRRLYISPKCPPRLTRRRKLLHTSEHVLTLLLKRMFWLVNVNSSRDHKDPWQTVPVKPVLHVCLLTCPSSLSFLTPTLNIWKYLLAEAYHICSFFWKLNTFRLEKTNLYQEL